MTLDARAYEDWLGARLGLEVSISDLQHAAPGTDRLTQADLLDGETGLLLARAENVTSRKTADGVDLHCESIFIPRSRLMALWQLLHVRALREPRLLARPISLCADQVILSSKDGQTELTDWRFQIGRREGGSFATAAFRERKTEAQPIELFITRQIDRDTWTTELDLLTESPVGVTTLVGETALISGSYEQLTFHGHLWLQWTSQHEWSLDLAGKLDGMRLQHLVSGRFPHRLSGDATVMIRQLEITAGQMQQFEGELIGGAGEVSASLLQAASDYLDMRSGHSTAEESEVLMNYSELGLLFRIDREGALLRGTCEGDQPGIILAGQEGPLLVESADQPQHTFNLIRALANERSIQIFWTETCKPILDLLPPPVIASKQQP